MKEMKANKVKTIFRRAFLRKNQMLEQIVESQNESILS
jgi:hypothetical protein